MFHCMITSANNNIREMSNKDSESRDLAKVVRSPPFAQLFTIHAFVRRGDTAKQIPLVYVVMSGKSKKDYIAVLVAIQEMLDDEWAVQDFVVDYEAAMWEALRATFVDADIHGCVFHWAQAVWRKVQALGLATSYMERQSTHAFIGKLLSLPFLPEEHTLPTFQFLADLTDDHQLQPLLSYIYRTWFRSTVWAPAQWSVYGQSIRTNNDVEGWHRRLNYKANGKPPFYLLLELLYKESAIARTQVTLVTELRLKKYQRKCYSSCAGKVQTLWQQYRDGELTTSGLLKAISAVYRPSLG